MMGERYDGRGTRIVSETFRREDNNLIMTSEPKVPGDNRMVNISGTELASVFGSLSRMRAGIIIVINADGKSR